MSGDKLGDKVHNFFAQDNSLQGQHHSQIVEGNWPVLNSSFWAGNEGQVDLLSSNNKNHNSQHSDLHRGEGSYPLHVTHGLNFTQSNLNPDFGRSQSLNEQPNLNGFIYGNQFQQTRQNETNFLAVATASDQQGNGTDHQTKAVGFDLFGGQQQMSHQQSSIPQSMQHQQSDINNMHQLQQQLIMRKMQELQRQQQLQQLDLRHQPHLVNQVPPFAKHTSGTQSALVNGTPNSDTLQYRRTAGTMWLNQGSPMMQGSPNGLAFQPNIGHTQRSMDLVPQQVDQSLYGFPISNSKGLPANQYSQLMTDRSSMPEMSISSKSHLDNQHSLLPYQIGVHDKTSISNQKFQNENMFGLASAQSLNTEMISHEKTTRQASSPQNEAALDPTEEKILFGSDDNIWAAFGKDPHMSGDADNLFDSGGLLDGLPSLQSGSWSALMQSAVAETCSSDIVPQEWSGLTFHNNDRPSASQTPPMRNDSGKQATPIANDIMQMPSALSSGSFPPANGVYTNNVMSLNQHGHKFQNEPGQRLPSEMSQRFVQSLEEVKKRSNNSQLQKSVAEVSQTYRHASENPLEAERNAKAISPPWAPGQARTGRQPNSWNSRVAIPTGGDRVQNSHEAEKFPHISQNNRAKVMQGGNSLWKSNSALISAIELGDINYTVGSPQGNMRISSLNNAASVANSSNAGISNETSTFVQNNNLLNQWSNAHPPVRSQGGESLGRWMHQASERNQVLDSVSSLDKDEIARHEMENYDVKENSNDSHRSNLSQHTGDFREAGLSDASDSRSLPSGKQKSTNQLSAKVTAPRKFPYHPMGNVHEDVESTNRLQAMSQRNAHFGQSKLVGQVPWNSTAMEKGQSSELQRDTKGPDEETSHENLSGHVRTMSAPFSRPIDTYTSNKPSSSSQNMLELLPKVVQSKDHDAMNASSLLPEAEKLGRLPCSRSSVYQGFGLQLGPPSQRQQIRNHPLSSQNDRDTISSLYPGHAAAEIGDKAQQIVPTPLVQSLPSIQETWAEFKNDRSAFSGTRVSGQMLMNQTIDPLNGNASHSTHQHKIGIQFQQVSSNSPDSIQPNIVESSSMPPSHGFLNSQKVFDGEEQRLKESSGQPAGSLNTDPVPKMKASLGKASSMKNHLADSPAKPASAQNDIEAFGRSLKPNSFSHQNYSSLNQMQDLRDSEFESSNRVSKRMKGSDPVVDVHEAASKERRENEHNALFGDSLGTSMAVPSEDSRMLNFSRPAGILQRNTSQHGNLDSTDILGLDRDVGQSNSCSDYTNSVRVDQPQISPQMAPSWFKQYGTLKNGQMMQMYGTSKVTASRPGESPSPLGMSSIGLDMHNSEEKETASSVDAYQISNRHQNSNPSSIANRHFSSPESSQPNVTGQLVNVRPKKRKSATSEFHPWHKEISEGSKFFWTISMAESDWNKAVNRRTEKVEADAELTEDGPPVLRSKRRLILTTQLMQQLLRPASTAILSADASSKSNYEIVPYVISRMVLGEACSKVSHSVDLDVPHHATNLHLKKGESSARNGGLYSKVIEEVMGTTRKIETDFLRLEKSASISDLRVEFQDLEKFSVINRFARFHGRGPTDNNNTDTLSADATQKPIPQRYVTAVPVPRILPDRVHCLSL